MLINNSSICKVHHKPGLKCGNNMILSQVSTVGVPITFQILSSWSFASFTPGNAADPVTISMKIHPTPL